MTDHPITPPPELVRGWLNEFHAPCPAPGLAPGEATLHIATQAARWGADQELEACCEYLTRCAAWEPEDVAEFLYHRRPKPPSLKEQALEALDRIDQFPAAEDQHTIRRALEQLDD